MGREVLSVFTGVVPSNTLRCPGWVMDDTDCKDLNTGTAVINALEFKLALNEKVNVW